MNRIEMELELLRDWSWFLEVTATFDESVLGQRVSQDHHDPSVWWTVKDHIAHCFGVYDAGTRVVREFFAEGGERPFITYLLPPSKRDLDAATNLNELLAAVDESTHAIWDRYRNYSWTDLLSVGQQARGERLVLISSLSDEELARSLPGAQWGDGTLGGYLLNAAGNHQRMHLKWIMTGLGNLSDSSRGVS